MDYDTAKNQASDGDPAERIKLAQRADVPPEVLVFLADDPDPEVRRVAARNPAMPRKGDLALTKDVDAQVRAELAEKIGRALPELTDGTRDRIYKMTLSALENLARDVAEHVRATLAEVVKEMSELPHSVARTLASDNAASVAVPVLRSSPILTDNDLTEIAARTHLPEAVRAIAERAYLSPEVASAVAESGDERAIASLLANHNAQLREETLESLVEAAPAREAWHAPLVRRPLLPNHIAERLADFVAAGLVRELRDRHDLDGATAQKISQRLDERLKAGDTGPAGSSGQGKHGGKAAGASDTRSEIERLMAEAEALNRQRRLDDNLVVHRLASGDKSFATAAVAVLAGVTYGSVEQIVNSHSSRAVCALAWRAGLNANTALQLQISLAGIPPHQAVRPRSGAYPLSTGDMRWQLEFFGIT